MTSECDECVCYEPVTVSWNVPSLLERRMDDFAAALAALKDLSDVITTLCGHTR